MSDATLIFGDCLDAMRKLDAASVDAVVTDPPYGIRFMGQAWDGAAIEADARRNARDTTSELRLTGSPDSPSRKLIPRTGSAYQTKAGEAGSYDFSLTGNRAFQAWVEAWASEALRVLKPGGHALVFGGTRTYHRLACGLEDAGFEIRDCLVWLYGTGFPKSLDVSKAIDRAAGAEREVIDRRQHRSAFNASSTHHAFEAETTSREVEFTAPATPDAERWQGWGTALKPAHEPIVVARKPLGGTVAANVLEHGTGAINVDACRIAHVDDADLATSKAKNPGRDDVVTSGVYGAGRPQQSVNDEGRWPANVVLDEASAAMLDEQSGERAAGNFPANNRTGFGDTYRGGSERNGLEQDRRPTEAGGPSRFFYCAKTSRAERNAGLEGFEEREQSAAWGDLGPVEGNPRKVDSGHVQRIRNHHPTVKPLALMRWLVRLVTPSGGKVLDPFLGSGTTGIAAALEGFDFVGVEREADYLAIAQARIAFWRDHGDEALRIVAEQERAEARRQMVAEVGQLDLLA